jgi:hypothetical protein
MRTSTFFKGPNSHNALPCSVIYNSLWNRISHFAWLNNEHFSQNPNCCMIKQAKTQYETKQDSTIFIQQLQAQISGRIIIVTDL